jgi:hypothetical protein
MFKEAIQPPPFVRSVYGPEPRHRRAASLPGLVSLGVRELFPDIVPEMYRYGDDASVIRRATEDALKGVDMSMIRPGDSVNIVSCEHGFSVMAGEAYAEMLKTLWDVVQERTGCENLRLRVGAWNGFREAEEVIEHFGLRQYFGEDKVDGYGPWDKGVPIETEAGTLYGINKVYDADWFIHAYYDDAREIYLHRYLCRSLKAFVMAYARLETRGLYHNFPTRSSNFLPKAIFDSPFVQERYAFTCLMRSSPAGITGIDADNDLYQIDRRITVDHLRDYGKLQNLFAEIDECVAVLDGGRWMYYLQAGGLCWIELAFATRDHFDLSNPKIASGFDLYDPEMMLVTNSRIKAMVINQAWRGLPLTGMAFVIPTILVGHDLADLFAKDPTNSGLLDVAVTAETLDAAMLFAHRLARTDKVVVFDGSYGHINISPSMAQFFLDKAPEVSRRIDGLVPTWLKQRGIDPETVGVKG